MLPERDVILQERGERIDNEPGARLGEAMDAALFLNHPYRLPVIGWRHEMEGYTTEDALAFYERFYAPNNAVLVVGGDVTVDEVRALAEKYFGPIPNGETVTAPAAAGAAAERAAPRVADRSSGCASPICIRSYQAPSFRTCARATKATRSRCCPRS